jgi:hypothetical protein
LVDHRLTLVFHADDGKLYELDGRKKGPVLHGDTTEMTMLQDACKVVKVFMDWDPGEMRFTIQWVDHRLTLVFHADDGKLSGEEPTQVQYYLKLYS